MSRVVCPWDLITSFVIDAFKGYGVPEEDVKICADVLLESDRRGIESHGCNRFKPIYLDRIKAGIQSPVTNFEILKETETTAVIDGHDGMGQVIAYRAMQMAIDKAKKYGTGMTVVRNSCHYGIAGYYATQAAKQGCIGITGTNARPSVAPTWGVDGMFGTNPLTIGIPTDEPFNFILDCATSITQNGKIEYYIRTGEPVHQGTVITKDGKEYEGDPDQALKMIRKGDAALLPLGGAGEALGGYKGYGLSVMVDILCAMLSGAPTGPDVIDPPETSGRVSHFFAAIKIAAFTDPREFRRHMDEMLSKLKNSPRAAGCDRIYVPGEKEFEMEERSGRLGIRLDRKSCENLNFLAEKYRIEAPPVVSGQC